MASCSGYFLLPGDSGRIRTLYLRSVRRVFYHCSTGAHQITSIYKAIRHSVLTPICCFICRQSACMFVQSICLSIYLFVIVFLPFPSVYLPISICTLVCPSIYPIVACLYIYPIHLYVCSLKGQTTFAIKGTLALSYSV